MRVYTHTHKHTLGFKKGGGRDCGLLSRLLSFLFPFQNYQWQILLTSVRLFSFGLKYIGVSFACLGKILFTAAMW